MITSFADQTAQDLAIYLAAHDVMDGIRPGTRLTEHQARMQQVVSNFYPACPDDTYEGVHNAYVASAPYQTVVNGKTVTATWRRCTCGLIEGAQYFQ
jgi:hypothetical protein